MRCNLTTHPASVADAHVARTVAFTIAYNNHPTLPSPALGSPVTNCVFDVMLLVL